MRLDWEEIHHLQTSVGLEEILQKRVLRGPRVAQEDEGIDVDPDARPCFFKARSVHFIFREGIEAELVRLQEQGTIEPIQFSKWAAPIVPVVKSDGNIRICGDYKTTVNQLSLTLYRK